MLISVHVSTGFVIENVSWPTDATWAKIRGWSPGGAGGGSNSAVPGGAGASGCYFESFCTRPASGISKVAVDTGAGATPANDPVDGAQAGLAYFYRDYQDENPPWCGAIASGGGQPSVNGAGADGGAGAVPVGSHVSFFVLGGQGQASYGNNPSQLPKGADAPCGGRGGNNGQDGMFPGGGGAPGTSALAGGAGGAGQIVIEFYSGG